MANLGGDVDGCTFFNIPRYAASKYRLDRTFHQQKNSVKIEAVAVENHGLMRAPSLPPRLVVCFATRTPPDMLAALPTRGPRTLGIHVY